MASQSKSQELIELRRALVEVALEFGVASAEVHAVRERISALSASEKKGSRSPDGHAQASLVFDVAIEVDDGLEECPVPDFFLKTEAEMWLQQLLAFHREMAERLIEINRELARQGEPAEADLLERSEWLKSKLSDLESEIDEAQKNLKAQEREEKKSDSAVIPKGADGNKALVRNRHPNRDFFLANLFDYSLKDDGASMEAPIFTLCTKPDLSVWEWKSKDGSKSLTVVPSVRGRATQHDKDVLIYVISQLTEALNRGRDDAKNRTVRFTVYDFLVTTNRRTDGESYKRLGEAFERLAGTRITTDIRTGGQRTREGFGVIDRWKIIEKSKHDERMIAVEVTLSEWLYKAVEAFEVLTIHPDYFRLRKPVARRLYEIARKHCGHQSQWSIGLELLQAKAGSKSSLKEFRRAVRSIQLDDSLPDYRFVLGEDDKVTFYDRDQVQQLMSALRKSTKK